MTTVCGARTIHCVGFHVIYGLLTKREVKIAGHWSNSFLGVLRTETESRSINTKKKKKKKRENKKLGQYLAILTKQGLANKRFLIWKKNTIFLRSTAGNSERATASSCPLG